MHDSPRSAKRRRLNVSADRNALDSTDDELLSQTSIFTPSKRPNFSTTVADWVAWRSAQAYAAADVEDDDDLLLPNPRRGTSVPQSIAKLVKLSDHAKDGASTVACSGQLSTLTKTTRQERTTFRDDGQAELVSAPDACAVKKRNTTGRSMTPRSASTSVGVGKDEAWTQPSRSSKRQRRTPKKYLKDLEDLEDLKNMSSKPYGSGKKTNSARRRNERGSLQAAESPRDPRRTETSPSINRIPPIADVTRSSITAIRGTTLQGLAAHMIEHTDAKPADRSTPSRSSKRNKASISSVLQKIEDSPSARLSSTKLPSVVESPSKTRSTTIFVTKLLDSETDDGNDNEDLSHNDEKLPFGHKHASGSINAIAPNTGPRMSLSPIAAQDSTATYFNTSTMIELEEAVTAHPEPFGKLKSVVMEQITGQRNLPSQHQDEEWTKVHTLLEQTVAAGESNSMLIVGTRESGKSALLRSILQDLMQKYEDTFYLIRLNGFIHTDDKLALREMWRQIGQEMEVEDEGLTKNYADTLSTLLALLSHLPENSDGFAGPVVRSIVFVIDEFDLFAAHPRQTLLYNLFDIAQSRKAPIAVLGLTTRVDVVESLEKRVKSRFSHRSLHLSLPRSIAEFRSICKSKLQIDAAEEQIIAPIEGVSSQYLVRDSGAKHTLTVRDMIQAWNASIEVWLRVFGTQAGDSHPTRISSTYQALPTTFPSSTTRLSPFRLPSCPSFFPLPALPSPALR